MPAPDEGLDPDAAGAIIRRATELDQERSTSTPGAVERRALEAAADEVGISADAIRLAMAEHDAGLLGPPDPSRSLLGPARARSVQTIDGSPQAVRTVVEKWLKSQLLEVHRRDGTEVEWRRRADLGAKLRRKLDPTKRVRLGDVDGVVSSIVGDGAGRAVVRLEADLTHTRDGLRTGLIAAQTAAVPLCGAAAAYLLDSGIVFLLGFPSAVVLGGTGLLIARKTLASELEDAQRVLDLFLDELARSR